MSAVARWTTWGPTRGGCGHEHESEAAATACLDRDWAGCRTQGGYSDRSVRTIEPGEATAYDVTRGPGRRPVGRPSSPRGRGAPRVSVRLAPDEMDAIAAAARAEDVSPEAYLRTAGVARARSK